MFSYFKKRRERLIKDIARSVRSELSTSGWEKFLPPVALRDAVYLVTENGTIYRMTIGIDGMEQICMVRP